MRYAVLAMVIGGVCVAGCTEGARTGGLTGGALGAATGAIIGHQSGETGEGAAIGAATGALAGGLIGDQMHKSRRSNPRHLAITEIVEMSQQGVPDQVIVDEIDRTNSEYYLKAEVISYLQGKGVSDRVINYMIETGR
ncbi:MAG: hypothetical protein GF333_03985 [Candidatus Omnitrophica bacterium]|nr:hypothetical protein [Candidatus Omnitrophota bacterium]